MSTSTKLRWFSPTKGPFYVLYLGVLQTVNIFQSIDAGSATQMYAVKLLGSFVGLMQEQSHLSMLRSLT